MALRRIKPAASPMSHERAACLRLQAPVNATADSASFRRILEVQNHTIMILRHQFNCGDCVLIMQIAEDDKEAPLLNPRHQFPHPLSECCGFVPAVTPELMHPLHDGGTGQRGRMMQ